MNIQILLSGFDPTIKLSIIKELPAYFFIDLENLSNFGFAEVLINGHPLSCDPKFLWHHKSRDFLW